MIPKTPFQWMNPKVIGSYTFKQYCLTLFNTYISAYQIHHPSFEAYLYQGNNTCRGKTISTRLNMLNMMNKYMQTPGCVS